MLKIGSLFSGYAGLDLAVEKVFGAEPAWFVEFDKNPARVLHKHYPSIPNFGDVTAVDWEGVPYVDIITGGSPCQDLSHAGARAGMTEGTRSNLWVNMREAIATVRPRWVVWENVMGARSAKAYSDVERTEGRVGDTNLRALGRVLGDLASLRYDCRWHSVRASDIGAPHRRERVFVVARDATGINAQRPEQREGFTWRDERELGPTVAPASNTTSTGLQGHTGTEFQLVELAQNFEVAADTFSGGHGGEQVFARVGFLDDGDAGIAQERQRAWEQPEYRVETDWGQYRSAIGRWEHTLGRCAPTPLYTSPRGAVSPSAAFVEWMMGLDAGWVSGVEGLNNRACLKILGNGVVPQQAEAALREMLSW